MFATFFYIPDCLVGFAGYETGNASRSDRTSSNKKKSQDGA